MAAMPARLALERGDWKAAAALPVTPTSHAHIEAITHYARAIGAAHTGDVAAARSASAALDGLHKKLDAARNNYWATEVEIQRLAVAGWIALAEGKADEALKFMRASADLEDRNEKHIVTPGRVVPARELLGEMLLELKQPKQALAEFQASQLREPNRFRNFYGSALAAEGMGDKALAAKYYAQAAAQTKKSEGKRPEIARARTVVASR
jgi:tetratricopeptide (TPR) repeat protein